jgi:hypothetical protein
MIFRIYISFLYLVGTHQAYLCTWNLHQYSLPLYTKHWVAFKLNLVCNQGLHLQQEPREDSRAEVMPLYSFNLLSCHVVMFQSIRILKNSVLQGAKDNGRCPMGQKTRRIPCGLALHLWKYWQFQWQFWWAVSQLIPSEHLITCRRIQSNLAVTTAAT